MSIVIAAKFRNGVVIASDRQVTTYSEKLEDKATKIIQVDGKNMFLGGVGTLRELQQMFCISGRLFSPIKDKLNEYNLVDTVNRLTYEFREAGFIEQQQILKSLYGQFLIADAYSINLLFSDLSIISDLDYYAIGSGQDLAMGYLNTVFNGSEPQSFSADEIVNILSECIRTCCKDHLYVDNNIDIYCCYKYSKDIVKDDVFDIVNRCEYNVIGKPDLKAKNNCDKNCTECPHNIRFVFNKKLSTMQSLSTGIN